MSVISIMTRLVVPSNGMQVAMRCPLPLQLRHIRTIGPPSHQFSVSSRAASGEVVPIASFFQAAGSRLGVQTRRLHDWREGDRVTISGSSRPAYNTTHEVAAVLSENTAVFTTSYAGEALDGTGQYVLDDDRKFLYLLVPAQTASGVQGQWDGDVLAVNMDKLAGRNAVSSNVLYLTASLAGTYLVTLRGMHLYAR